MARRDTRTDVELVDDDAPEPAGTPGATAGTAPGTPPGTARPQRTALVVGAVVVVALVAVGVVGQAVVDRRERASLAAVATQPAVVGLLDRPPSPAWEATSSLNRLADARTAGGLLVAVPPSLEGPVAARAVDAGTGAEVWQVELLDGTTRADLGDDVAPGSDAWSSSGYCQSVGAEEEQDRVVCAVHDGADVLTADGGSRNVPPSTVRVVTLDGRDGTVVADLTDALDGGRPTSFVLVDDLVVLAVAHGGGERAEGQDGAGSGDAEPDGQDTGAEGAAPDGQDTGAEGAAPTEVVAVASDGAVAWRVPVQSQRPGEVYVESAGDLVVASTGTEALLLDAAGRTVRTVPLGERSFVWSEPSTGRVRLVEMTGETDVTTTLLRTDGTDAADVTVDGYPVPVVVDDGSVPGLTLTTTDDELLAWDAHGVQLWGSDVLRDWQVLLLDGRLHVMGSLALVTLDARTGEELWRSEVTREAPVTDGRHLLVLARERGGRSELVAVSPADGSEVWRAPLPEGTDRITSFHHLLAAVQDDADGSERITVLR